MTPFFSILSLRNILSFIRLLLIISKIQKVLTGDHMKLKNAILLKLLVPLFMNKSFASSTIASDRLDLPWWQDRHKGILQYHKENSEDIEIVFIGDSITQRWEQNGATIWSEIFKPMGVSNLGFDGDKTEHVIWRIDHGELAYINPNLVVLMIGTNNTWTGTDTPEEIAGGIKAVLDRIEKNLKDTKVLLLGIFPAFEPDSQHRKHNNRVNQLIKNFDDGYKIHYKNINSIFLEADLSISPKIMPDGIHLSQEGYKLWADSLKKLLKTLTN